VRFFSPIDAEPSVGREAASMVLSTVFEEVFEDFHYVNQLDGENFHLLTALVLGEVSGLYLRAAERRSCRKLSGMYIYGALTRNASGTYHRDKQHPGALLSENLWGDRWGKGKEESGTRDYIRTAHRRGTKAPGVNQFTTRKSNELTSRARGYRRLYSRAA
jgi:hypothetical protein